MTFVAIGTIRVKCQIKGQKHNVIILQNVHSGQPPPDKRTHLEKVKSVYIVHIYVLHVGLT